MDAKDLDKIDVTKLGPKARDKLIAQSEKDPELFKALGRRLASEIAQRDRKLEELQRQLAVMRQLAGETEPDGE